jgi:hypothetical protein
LHHERHCNYRVHEHDVAIDLGKYKSVACVHDQATGEMAFTAFETTRAELGKELASKRPSVVIIEACLLAGLVHDLCRELGVRCLVANSASEAWKFNTLPRFSFMGKVEYGNTLDRTD